MHPLFQNRYAKFIGIGILGIVFVLIFVSVILASLNSARSHSSSLSKQGSVAMFAPNMPSMGMNADSVAMERGMADSLYYPTPQPAGGYSNLEAYETASYNVTAKTRQFDNFCATLGSLKARADVDFKNLNSSTNYCNATFYTDEENAPSVLATLQQHAGVEVTHNVTSVTRHRQQIQSQTDIIRQQLASVSKSLAIAETEFDEIAAFAREQNDAETLSGAIREKLNLVDTLTQRKISLTSQLDSIYQQAADLEERMNVVEFHVSASRLTPIIAGESERKWEQAWDELSDTLTDTLIGPTAFFGVFLLWVVRVTIYILVLLLVLRGLWKFVQFVWKKW
tara:strand:- start:6549 stop:7562 length:1014 start_codon:yes stop_codon:yes gene_type:complete